MTINDVEDGLLLAKLKSGKIHQAMLTTSEMRKVLEYAGSFRERLNLVGQNVDISWDRPVSFNNGKGVCK